MVILAAYYGLKGQLVYVHIIICQYRLYRLVNIREKVLGTISQPGRSPAKNRLNVLAHHIYMSLAWVFYKQTLQYMLQPPSVLIERCTENDNSLA